MRTSPILGRAALCALAAATLAPAILASPALAQPQPRGSYERQCSDIRMNGQFLSATCRNARGSPAQSSINVASCGGDIGVDAGGGLTCTAPGVAPAAGGYAAPAPRYDDRRDDRGRDDRGRDGRGRDDRGRGRDSVTLYDGRGMRGRSVQIVDDTANLSRTGLNDQVRSIQLGPRSGPWIVCTDADYRGRCTTVTRSISDTRDIGMRGAISSLRPAR